MNEYIDTPEHPHEYRINGRVVPSVTQVLGDLIPGWHASDWYLQRGQAVHACAAMIARGQTFEHDPQIEGQVAALRRYFREVNPVVLSVERQVYSERYQYAGTLDLTVITGSGGRHSGVQCIVDYKASFSASLPYQLAGYAIAYGHNVRVGYGVEIHEDGSYKMSEVYDLRRYKQGWLALLTAYGIRRQCGVKETEGGEE